MKHRRLLIGGIIAIPIGIILWMIIGPIIQYAGVSQHYEGFWPFGSTVTDLTATYWIGVAISIIGICFLAFGIVGIVLAFVLEYLDKGQTEQNIPNSRYDPSVRVKAMVDALPDKEKEDSDKSEKKE